MIPDIVQWKAELMFGGLRFTDALVRAVEDGAYPNFWPYRRRHESGKVDVIPVPYLFDLGGRAVARIRVDDRARMEVQRDGEGRYWLHRGDDVPLTEVKFVPRHAWQAFRTGDGLAPFQAGAEQLGDMITVNVAPGCEYFTVSKKCSFCAYGRFDKRALTLGQKQGEVVLDELIPKRIEAVMRAAAASGTVGHVYITGGSVLDPEAEVERYLPVIEAVRRGVGDGMRVCAGSGAVDLAGSKRFRAAGADSACFNLETWDAATFEACCPGKAAHVGRDRWIAGLLGAVEVFGGGNVGSAFVAGLELVPPGPGMTHEQFLESALTGAAWLLDRGVMPLYSPLWPVDGTSYGVEQGIPPALYVQFEHELYKLRAARRQPVPGWLCCPACSYMLLEVDFDRALGLAEDPCASSHAAS